MRSQTETQWSAQLEPSEKDMQQMRREIEKSMKAAAEGYGEDVEGTGEVSQADAERHGADARGDSGSMPSQKDFDEMTSQQIQAIACQTQQAAEIEKMKQQMQASCPARKISTKMRQPDSKSSMKNFTPQMQQEMEQLKKQMEQQKLDLQQMMQDFKSQEF